MLGKTLNFIPNGSLVAENGPSECRLLGSSGSGRMTSRHAPHYGHDSDDMEQATAFWPLSDEPSRRHSNGPFSATCEPFRIKLSVFLSTNHLRNTLESFVLP